LFNEVKSLWEKITSNKEFIHKMDDIDKESRQQIQVRLNNLRTEEFRVVVLGAQGAGKSNLVNSCLLPKDLLVKFGLQDAKLGSLPSPSSDGAESITTMSTVFKNGPNIKVCSNW